MADRSNDKLTRFQTLFRNLGADHAVTGYNYEFRFVILHYDLNTRNSNRREVYEAIKNRLSSFQGASEMTESVYAIPVPEDKTPRSFAINVWTQLGNATLGKLVDDDLFFLMFPSRAAEHLGSIAQIVRGMSYLMPAPDDD